MAYREAGGWRVELSRRAVEALRTLPREEQRTVAGHIGNLERAGPPPRPRDGGPIEVHAGSQVLVCDVTEGSKRIVVVTLVSSETPASEALGRLALRHVARNCEA